MSSPTKNLYFPALDGLRFFAFLLVFIHHLPRSELAPLAFVGDHGWVGVHVFLFLSAYLLTAILKAEQDAAGRISVGRFLIRRALRIWPLYFTFSAAAIGWTVLRRGYNPGDLPHILGLGMFGENWVSGAIGYSTILFTAHLWTISLEEQFYLLLPWLLAKWLGAKRRLGIGLISLWAAFVIARVIAVVLGAPHPWIWTSLFCADSLILGTWLGAQRVAITDPRFRAFAIVGGLVALGSPGLLRGVEITGWHLVPLYSFVALGAALLCTAAIDAPALAPLLANRAIRYLGKISYGLYVFHLVAIDVTERVFQKRHLDSWPAIAAVSLGATIAISAISYQLLEKPFLRRKRRFETIHTRPV